MASTFFVVHSLVSEGTEENKIDKIPTCDYI